MSEENRALIRRFIEEVVDGGNLGSLERYVSPTVFRPDGSGIEGLRSYLSGLRKSFPDLEYKVVETVAEGERVAVRIAAKGTQSGRFMGLQATGRRLSIWGLVLFRVEGGMITEHWEVLDVAGISRQLREVSA